MKGYGGGSLEDFIVTEVKAPLTTAIAEGRRPSIRLLVRQLSQLPVPTESNTVRKNTLVLIGLRERFFSNPLHTALYGWTIPLWNGFIILYDYDGYYADRIDFVLEYLLPKWTGVCSDNLSAIVSARDKFFEYEANPERISAFKFIWDNGVRLYPFRYFRHPADWLMTELKTEQWEPRQREHPWPQYWREWGPYERRCN